MSFPSSPNCRCYLLELSETVDRLQEKGKIRDGDEASAGGPATISLGGVSHRHSDLDKHGYNHLSARGGKDGR